MRCEVPPLIFAHRQARRPSEENDQAYLFKKSGHSAHLLGTTLTALTAWAAGTGGTTRQRMIFSVPLRRRKAGPSQCSILAAGKATCCTAGLALACSNGLGGWRAVAMLAVLATWSHTAGTLTTLTRISPCRLRGTSLGANSCGKAG